MALGAWQTARPGQWTRPAAPVAATVAPWRDWQQQASAAAQRQRVFFFGFLQSLAEFVEVVPVGQQSPSVHLDIAVLHLQRGLRAAARSQRSGCSPKAAVQVLWKPAVCLHLIRASRSERSVAAGAWQTARPAAR